MIRPVRWVLTRNHLSDHQGLAAGGALLLMALGTGVLVAWPTVSDASWAATLAGDLPGGVADMFGLAGTSLTEPTGYLDATFLSVVFPAVLLILTVPLMVRAVAGAESGGEMEFLAAQPVRRSQILVERFVSVSLLALEIGMPALILVATGASRGRLGIAAGSILGAGLRGLLLVVVVNAVVAAVAGASGRLALTSLVGLVTAVGVFALIALEVPEFSPARWLIGELPLGGTFSPVGSAGITLVAMVALWMGSRVFRLRDLRLP